MKSLECRHRLSSALLKLLKNPPDALVDKIFMLMKDNKIEIGAYKSMGQLSKNERLKKLFE